MTHASSADPLLAVRGLRVGIDGTEAVRGVSFAVRPGQATALVGESGAGKSLTARAILGLPPHGARISGSVRLDGEEIAGAGPSVYRRLWGRRIAYVPQDALAVLSPVHTVGDQLAAAVRSVARVPRAEARRRAVAALDGVGIADAARRARALPHEFSGGMRQRAVIAMALVNGPGLIVADEPTTALDPRVRDQVLDVLAQARAASGAALLLITHDLELAETRADEAVVLYAGRVAESGPAHQVFGDPRSPYTAGLVASKLPGWRTTGTARRGQDSLSATARTPQAPLPAIAGTPPSPLDLPRGCAFAPRCPLAAQVCRDEEPAPAATDPAGPRTVACHRAHQLPMPAVMLYDLQGLQDLQLREPTG
ncbi:ABC transporter ATP-binding protein [Streptomyces sp. TRM66268-LWL]|uniref:ABC transporter ATP-binding protein n=1 Tax=Streptomyces polyasparticus TaxID=2767826 RepID=A0ABR7SLN0_9ACTN|nr:ABC transporter ATP-binding protein [Streptomyces polyasparticus]MBC9716239.1 ABC transporter ATP-binding protein [Streptomyces polyasparticus]